MSYSGSGKRWIRLAENTSSTRQPPALTAISVRPVNGSTGMRSTPCGAWCWASGSVSGGGKALIEVSGRFSKLPNSEANSSSMPWDVDSPSLSKASDTRPSCTRVIRKTRISTKISK
jgi:hypothetical protein